MKSNCVVCGAGYYPPTGALCLACEEVTDTFTDAEWCEVEAMSAEDANQFLRARAASPDDPERGGDDAA